VREIMNVPPARLTTVVLVGSIRFYAIKLSCLERKHDADDRARELDPAVVTSISHTYFLAGDYAAAIDTYGGRTGYYLDAAAWAALGEKAARESCFATASHKCRYRS
jgi:hypothetical protein